MNKIKILIFSKETQGGNGLFINHLLKIDNNQFIKKIFLYKKSEHFLIKKYFLINNYYDNGNQFSWKKFLLFLKNIFLTYNILLKQKPDLIVTCDLYASILILLIKRFFIKKIKIIVFVNNNLLYFIEQKPNVLFQNLLKILIRSTYGYGNVVVFTSKSLQSNFFEKTLIKNRSLIINNGLDFHRLNQTPLNKDEELLRMEKRNTIKIISVGRLSQQKDFETLIKAFYLVNKKITKLDLYIIGDGELKNRLIKLTKKLKLNNNVHFLGWRNDPFPFLRNSDLYVFSSKYEGFGIAIIEAMGCGLPIIATDTPYGPSDILKRGKYGVLIPVGNPCLMAQKMELLIRNKKLRKKYAKLALTRSKDFDLRLIIKQYENLFRNMQLYERYN